MRKLLKFLKPFRWLVALVFLLMVVESMAALYLPTIMADIVNNGIIRAVAEGTPQQTYIIQRGILMLLVTLGSGLAAIGAGYFAPRVAAGFARDLRREIFVKVESFSCLFKKTFRNYMVGTYNIKYNVVKKLLF